MNSQPIFLDVAEREPELLAHHYTEAEATVDRALEYWKRAANRAASSLAYVELALGTCG